MCEWYHIFISGEHAKVFDRLHALLMSYLYRTVLDTMQDILLLIALAHPLSFRAQQLPRRKDKHWSRSSITGARALALPLELAMADEYANQSDAIDAGLQF